MYETQDILESFRVTEIGIKKIYDALYVVDKTTGRRWTLGRQQEIDLALRNLRTSDSYTLDRAKVNLSQLADEAEEKIELAVAAWRAKHAQEVAAAEQAAV